MRTDFRLIVVFILLGLAVLWAPLPAAAYTPQERIIRVEASSFAYQPGEIAVQKGDRVTLELYSRDVVHGLYIDGYDLEVRAEPGQPSRLTFIADRTGSFRLRCSVTCGALHPFMVAKLRVKPDDRAFRAAGLTLLLALAALVLRLDNQKIIGRRVEGKS